jgi:hypothetical protein
MAGSRTFNGTSDVITQSTSTSLNTLGGNVTIAAWIYLTDSTTGHAIWGGGGAGCPILRIDAGLAIEGLIDNNSFSGSNTAPGAMSLNTWTHVAMTYNDITDRLVHLYVNGVEVSPVASSSPPGAEGYDTGVSRTIGNDVISEFFQGRLAELRLYNIALSGAQIAAVAADTTGNPNVSGLAANLVAYLHLCGLTSPEPDASGNGNVGILTGTGTGTASPGYGGCSAPPSSSLNKGTDLGFMSQGANVSAPSTTLISSRNTVIIGTNLGTKILR